MISRPCHKRGERIMKMYNRGELFGRHKSPNGQDHKAIAWVFNLIVSMRVKTWFSMNGSEIWSRFSLRWSLGVPLQVISDEHQGQQRSLIMVVNS
ncbi:hypothetical protein VNO77_19106 [Canavalia gladiata]|uniref:Uncharacterized protein n=1 Tax=Canavalia gladiata TaxID=3824 RepID=A0AAN9QI84_CANGL